MTRIVTIVEGHGEVEAVPILVRRIAGLVEPQDVPDVPKPIRIRRNRLLKEGELERSVDLAARQCGQEDGILILIDADCECPRTVAAHALERARAARGDRRVRVVMAKEEFEAWFLAAMESIAGQRELRVDAAPPTDPESIRGAKQWLSDQMPPGRSYRETVDQAALASLFDLELARRRAPSFDKFFRDVCELLGTEAPTLRRWGAS